MDTTVYFIRHGEINNPNNVFYGGTLDLQLNDIGRKQVIALGRSLQNLGVRPDAVYTSHLFRAKESGQILAGRFGVTIAEDKRLGDNKIPQFAGLTQTEKEEKFPGKDEFDPNLEGHESRDEVLERMKSAFEDIVKAHEGKTVFIVGHGDPLRLLLHSLNHPNAHEIPPFDELPQLEKGSAQRMVIGKSGNIEYEIVPPAEIGNIRGKE